MPFLLPSAHFLSSPLACVRSSGTAWRTSTSAGSVMDAAKPLSLPSLISPLQTSAAGGGTARTRWCSPEPATCPTLLVPTRGPQRGRDGARVTCQHPPVQQGGLMDRDQRSGGGFGDVDATPLKQAQPDLWLEKPRPIFRNQSNPG